MPALPYKESDSSYFSNWSFLFSAIAVLDVGIWSYERLGGFDLSTHLYNWHPFLMTVSLVFLLSFTSLQFHDKTSKQDRDDGIWNHVILLILSLIIGSIGIIAAYQAKKNGTSIHSPKTLNSNTIEISTYSQFHPWIGLISMCLVFIYLFFGIMKYIIKYTEGFMAYIPIHKNVGVIAIIIAHIAALSGIYLHSNCGTNGGCDGGTFELIVLTLSLLAALFTIHSEYLHPENLCPDLYEKFYSKLDGSEVRHNSDEGDERDNLLGNNTYTTTFADNDDRLRSESVSSYSYSDSDEVGSSGKNPVGKEKRLIEKNKTNNSSIRRFAAAGNGNGQQYGSV